MPPQMYELAARGFPVKLTATPLPDEASGDYV